MDVDDGLQASARDCAIGGLPLAVHAYLVGIERGDPSLLSSWVAASLDHVSVGFPANAGPLDESPEVAGLDSVKLSIAALHAALANVRVKVCEFGPYPGEEGVWSIKFTLTGICRKDMPEEFERGDTLCLPGLVMAKIEAGRIARLRSSL